MELDKEDRKLVADLNLLTDKPVLYVCNVDEKSAATGNAYTEAVREAIAGERAEMLVIAAAPYVARMVESAAKEVDAGVIEAAQAMGCTNLQIIWHVLLPEAKPSLISGSIISTVTILSYTALAATLGGTGLGQVAIIYGHQRSQKLVVWVCVLLIVVIVQLIQIVGTTVVRKTDKRAR